MVTLFEFLNRGPEFFLVPPAHALTGSLQKGRKRGLKNYQCSGHRFLKELKSEMSKHTSKACWQLFRRVYYRQARALVDFRAVAVDLEDPFKLELSALMSAHCFFKQWLEFYP